MPTVLLTGRPRQQRRQRRDHRDAGARPVLGNRARRHVQVELAPVERPLRQIADPRRGCWT